MYPRVQWERITARPYLFGRKFIIFHLKSLQTVSGLQSFLFLFVKQKKPGKIFMKKYSLSDKPDQSHYDIEKIKCYSKQVLEALNYLYSKGLFYGKSIYGLK